MHRFILLIPKCNPKAESPIPKLLTSNGSYGLLTSIIFKPDGPPANNPYIFSPI